MLGSMEHNRLVKKQKEEGVVKWVRALPALLEDSGSIPGTHVVAHNCSQFQFQGESSTVFWLPGVLGMHAGQTLIHENRQF